MAEAAATGSKDKVIDVSDLTFRYASQEVVNVAHMQLDAGESISVIGPSGCGKTTFMHLLAGLLKPATGRIYILGQDITQMSGANLDKYRGKHIGMVFQRLLLMPALSVRENIVLAQRLARVVPDKGRIDALLEQLGLSEFADRKPQNLSLGQAQRVAIARALVHNPALLLADEPTSALDDGHAEQALALLKRSAQEAGAALLVVTHDQRVRGQLDRELEMGQHL